MTRLEQVQKEIQRLSGSLRDTQVEMKNLKEQFAQAKMAGHKETIDAVKTEMDKIYNQRVQWKNDLYLMMAEEKELMNSPQNGVTA